MLHTSRVTEVIMVMTIFKHKVPADVSQFFHDLFVGFVVFLIRVIMRKKEINTLNMGRQSIGLGIV